MTVDASNVDYLISEPLAHYLDSYAQCRLSEIKNQKFVEDKTNKKFILDMKCDLKIILHDFVNATMQAGGYRLSINWNKKIVLCCKIVFFCLSLILFKFKTQ